MKKFFLLLVSLFYIHTVFSTQNSQEFFPSILVVDKHSTSHDQCITDLLSLQKSLIVNPLDIPETFQQTGFLLVPMTKEYVASLLEKKEAQIVCIYSDQTLLGYIILTVATEFEDLYQNPSTGRFETAIDLKELQTWLLDPLVGYIEQIAIRPGFSRMGLGTLLIEMSKTLKTHGLISDVFIYPVKNTPSLNFFFNQSFRSPGILYQYPGANVNFPYEHRTQVFFWHGNDQILKQKPVENKDDKL